MLNIYKQVLKIAKNFGKKTAIHCSGPDTGRFFLKWVLIWLLYLQI